MSKSKTQLQEEQQVKILSLALTRAGYVVRREPLSRGSAFRVKSGTCAVAREKFVFIDKRLPLEQQVGLLMDYALELRVNIADTELAELSQANQSLYSSQSQ